ncbi:hypothetical protein MED222_20839 [Vibrio sp. MED222]|nr:hypothetical protein MED222_20839 [Vibrio sp. MED222]
MTKEVDRNKAEENDGNQADSMGIRETSFIPTIDHFKHLTAIPF